MTIEEILTETDKLTSDKQKNLISFLVLKYLNPDKDEILEIFKNSNIDEKEKNIDEILKEFRGKGKHLWKNEDAQEYVNNLRKEDRDF